MKRLRGRQKGKEDACKTERRVGMGKRYQGYGREAERKGMKRGLEFGAGRCKGQEGSAC